jgi:hypothetical protein
VNAISIVVIAIFFIVAAGMLLRIVGNMRAYTAPDLSADRQDDQYSDGA